MKKIKERFWIMLLVSSLIAAVVSFFTTSFGLLYYFSFLLALPMALAVQMGLLGLAWLIGFGNRQIRPLMIALYLVTMIFSVVFSYVFLQSKLIERVKPAESQRYLFDDIRAKIVSFGNIINEGVNESEILSARLKMWLDMEEDKGWATKTCEEETHCYLLEVCRRVRGKIERWENISGRPYREGPGRELIHGALDEEYRAMVQIQNRLREFRDNVWSKNTVLSEGLTNRERLTLFDQLIASVPKKDFEAFLCRDVVLPVSPSYDDYARDAVIQAEKQVYAFDDFMDILGRGGRFKRSDYPTVFAMCLAIFIDLFVLMVAVGAALVDYRREDVILPDGEKIPIKGNTQLQEDFSEWVNGALLGQTPDKNTQIEFLRETIRSIKFDREGRNVLVPSNEEQFRFGVMLVKSKAAVASHTQIEGKEKTVFLLEDWVYLALTRFIRLAGETKS